MFSANKFAMWTVAAVLGISAAADVSFDQSLHRLDVSENWQVRESQNSDANQLPPATGYLPVTPPPTSFDAFGKSYWFKLRITNESETSLTRLLEVEHPFLRLAELQVYADGQLVDQQ